MVGWFETTRDDVGVELAAAPAPEQVEQAVVVARDEQRDALALVRVREAPVHRERLGDALGEGALELVAALVAAARARNSMRMKNVPPSGSVEYWSELRMFAPVSARKPETAATIPAGRARDEQPRDVLSLVRAKSRIRLRHGRMAEGDQPLEQQLEGDRGPARLGP